MKAESERRRRVIDFIEVEGAIIAEETLAIKPSGFNGLKGNYFFTGCLSRLPAQQELRGTPNLPVNIQFF